MSGQFWGPLTFSQHGDDLMILNIFTMLGIKTPSYIDVGAHHPFDISNTALLYKLGSTGINIEPNPNLIEQFNICRRNDKNLNIGISVHPGKHRFYMFDDWSGRNTFSMEEAKQFLAINPEAKIQKVLEIETDTLQNVVKKHCNGFWPNFLNMDAEGLDKEILSSVDWTEDNCPEVLCVEKRPTDEWGPPKTHFQYCRMISNVIYVHNRHRDGVLYK